MRASFNVRSARAADLAGIIAVHEAAFATHLEANLVKLLYQNGMARIALVALVDEQIVGHILFSPVSYNGLGLAPLAVMPQYQGQGIGAKLIERGIAACRSEKCLFIVVLGDPAYYARFGFKPAHEFGLRNEYGVKDEFMVQELKPGGMPLHGSLIQYADEFKQVGA